MEPNIDITGLSPKERTALEGWRLLEVIEKYNRTDDRAFALECLAGLHLMVEAIEKQPWPIGPKDGPTGKEQQLLVSIHAAAAEANAALGGREFKR